MTPESGVTFSGFILSLATTAGVHFGDITDPNTGERADPNLPAAAQMIELIEVLEAVRHDTAGPRLGRIRDVAPAVAAAKAAEEAMANSLKGKTVNDLVEKEAESG